MANSKVVGKCPHCGGKVVKEVKYLPSGRELRMGETAIAHTEERFFCEGCKTLFVSAPPEKLARSRRKPQSRRPRSSKAAIEKGDRWS